jgi:hypothetical protein
VRSAVFGAAALALAAAALLADCGATEDQLGIKLDGSVSESGRTTKTGSGIPHRKHPAVPRRGRHLSVTVDAVRTLDGDLQVTGFAIRDNRFETNGTMIGNATGTLASNGLHDDPNFQITERCDAPESNHQFGYELIIELRADDHDTSTTGFAIEYHGDHNAGTLKDRLGIYSCVDRTIALCKPDASTSSG